MCRNVIIEMYTPLTTKLLGNKRIWDIKGNKTRNLYSVLEWTGNMA